MPRDDIALSRLGTAADKFQSDSHEDKGAVNEATVIPSLRRTAISTISSSAMAWSMREPTF